MMALTSRRGSVSWMAMVLIFPPAHPWIEMAPGSAHTSAHSDWLQMKTVQMIKHIKLNGMYAMYVMWWNTLGHLDQFKTFK